MEKEEVKEGLSVCPFLVCLRAGDGFPFEEDILFPSGREKQLLSKGVCTQNWKNCGIGTNTEMRNNKKIDPSQPFFQRVNKEAKEGEENSRKGRVLEEQEVAKKTFVWGHIGAEAKDIAWNALEHYSCSSVLHEDSVFLYTVHRRSMGP
ncbi:hypothetical protein STEG23_027317 [Scotinomys teguina]